MTDAPSHESAESFAERTRVGFKAKADARRKEALFCFVIVIAASLTAPLFVTLGEGPLCGKIVPSVLSLSVAAFTSWLQLRKPQQLWALYRTCQRQIEDAQSGFVFRFGRFRGADNAETILAERVAEIAMYAHNEWIPMVPNPERIGQSVEASGASLPSADSNQ